MDIRYRRTKSTYRMPRTSRSPVENPLMSLQRMVDRYISMFEYEKTKSAILDDEIRELTGKLGELSTAKPVKKRQEDALTGNLKMQQKVNHLEHQLDITLTKLNKTSTSNRQLRDQIDTMRLNSLTEKEKIEKLVHQIENVEELKGQEQMLTAREVSIADRLVKSTDLLRSRSTNQRMFFNEKIGTLTVSYTQSCLKHNLKDSTVKIAQIYVDPRYKSKAENLDPTLVLKKLKAKWETIVADVNTKVIVTKRDLKIMNSGLSQIKKATGMVEIEEIVTTFVKSEDQNYSLSNYLSNLHRELEHVDQIYRRAKKSISVRANSITCGDEETEKLKVELKRTIGKAENRLHKLKVKATRIDEHLREAEDVVSAIMASFESHQFTANLPKFMDGADMGSDLLSALLRLEVFIDELVLFNAFQKEERSPALKLISSMANKVFQKDREPVREILKMNEIIAAEEEISEEPLSLAQLKKKANEKISLVTKMTIDDLPLLGRKKTIMRDKTRLSRETQ